MQWHVVHSTLLAMSCVSAGKKMVCGSSMVETNFCAVSAFKKGAYPISVEVFPSTCESCKGLERVPVWHKVARDSTNLRPSRNNASTRRNPQINGFPFQEPPQMLKLVDNQICRSSETLNVTRSVLQSHTLVVCSLPSSQYTSRRPKIVTSTALVTFGGSVSSQINGFGIRG